MLLFNIIFYKINYVVSTTEDKLSNIIKKYPKYKGFNDYDFFIQNVGNISSTIIVKYNDN